MQEHYTLLRATSRTFAVGIEALPHPLRDAVTLAYLVLRVSDYFEDSPTLRDEEKTALLGRWASLVDTAGEGPLPAEELRILVEAVAAEDGDLPDRKAALRAEAVLQGLGRLPPPFRAVIREHTGATTRGMARWIARGPDFATEGDLDDYMFEVAGRVGLLLTDLFCEYSRAIRTRARTLRKHAVSFGLGLQTVNVVRGLHEDPRRGWSFVPRSVLVLEEGTPDEAGFLDPRALPREEQRRILAFLTTKAARHIADALEYCRTLPRLERGIRLFCIIPAVLASRTLQVSAGNPRVFEEAVKVPRAEVRRIVLRTRLFWFSNRWLGAEARTLQEIAGPEPRERSAV